MYKIGIKSPLPKQPKKQEQGSTTRRPHLPSGAAARATGPTAQSRAGLLASFCAGHLSPVSVVVPLWPRPAIFVIMMHIAHRAASAPVARPPGARPAAAARRVVLFSYNFLYIFCVTTDGCFSVVVVV